MKGKSNAEKAYAQIMEMIATQRLQAGQQIVETTIAQQLHMSRTPVREAIRRLQEDGLVETVMHRGAFIKTATTGDLVMSCELAEGLEGMVAFLLAEKCRQGQDLSKELARSRVHVDAMTAFLQDKKFKDWVLQDYAFHMGLAELTGNSFLAQAYKRMRQQLNHVLWFINPTLVDKDQSNREHCQMLDAIAAGQVEEARRSAERHHRRVRDIIKDLQ
nr:GntR family transcriptional regulator [Maliibacterium massiliense]